MWIGIGVVAVLGYVLWKRNQTAKKEAEKQAALKAKISATKIPLSSSNAPESITINLNQTEGKLRTT